MINNATGDSAKHSGLMNAVAATNAAALAMSSATATGRRDEPVPPGGAGIAFVDVPVREPVEDHGRRPRAHHAHQDQARKTRAVGSPRAATNIEPSAKGSAKSVCEKRTNVSVRRTGARAEERVVTTPATSTDAMTGTQGTTCTRRP